MALLWLALLQLRVIASTCVAAAALLLQLSRLAVNLHRQRESRTTAPSTNSQVEADESRSGKPQKRYRRESQPLQQRMSVFLSGGGYSKKNKKKVYDIAEMEVMLTDLGDKLPWLCPVLRPEYTPYFNTAGTVLLGWMLVCWISHIVWTLFAPLAISTIAVVIVCPSTAKWLIKRLGPNAETALRNFVSKIQASMPEVR